MQRHAYESEITTARLRLKSRQHRADAVDLAQSRAVLVEQPGGLGLIVGELLIEPAHVGDQLPAQLQPNPFGGAAGPKRAQRRSGLGGGQVGRGRRRQTVRAAAGAVG